MKNITMIDVQELDDLVIKTYNKIYSFQQQDGCKEKGIEYFSVPIKSPQDYENDTVPKNVNDEEMGVSFKTWLARDTKQPLSSPYGERENYIQLWWYRNFYPSFEVLAQNMYEKGLLPAGDYVIDIDW